LANVTQGNPLVPRTGSFTSLVSAEQDQVIRRVTKAVNSERFPIVYTVDPQGGTELARDVTIQVSDIDNEAAQGHFLVIVHATSGSNTWSITTGTVVQTIAAGRTFLVMTDSSGKIVAHGTSLVNVTDTLGASTIGRLFERQTGA